MATPVDKREEYRYNRLTWAEMNDAIARQPVVILPTGSTEQHGRHLPIDVDLLLCESICLEAGRRAAGGILVLPPIPYGLNQHHIDFPGTIHIEPEVFIAFCLNVTKSVAYHGFEKILIVNGHGSNAPLIDIIARRTTLQTDSLCAACHYINLAVEKFREIMESEVIAHADEFETSLYLHLAPERVQMELAGADDDVMGDYLSSDSTRPYVRFNDYWSRWTDLGVHGDARPATAEKGEIIFETAVTPPGGAGGGVAQLAARGAPRLPRAAGADSYSLVSDGVWCAALPRRPGQARDDHCASCFPPRSARSSSWLGSWLRSACRNAAVSGIAMRTSARSCICTRMSTPRQSRTCPPPVRSSVTKWKCHPATLMVRA